ncbi:MAG: hypothetical protein A2Y62_02745 [Candidatus Fischerbacteria bacterium RBG_13_37_8]|uniref:DUF354 domain-containing protein n=1 Tax=Candidatus Fischerbacteria bacterium RBG_13_37_8 TaxID=1817863 RepID=A0A1F5VYY0_9BACT|nr:MAG: hypothetical protein A2Y62_02745 [Candidatus Fischerbacteria bacterium RBG_13_37_8]
MGSSRQNNNSYQKEKNNYMKKIWFDLTNTPHVHFFKPFIKRYSAYFNIFITARNFAETVQLAKNEYNISPTVIGTHAGKHKVKKAYCLIIRFIQMLNRVGNFDYAISCGGTEACIIAKLKHKKAITFDDNDLSPNWMYSHFTDFAFFPAAIPEHSLFRQGFKAASIIRYNGFKEDIYIADYEPDENFLNILPFRNYIVVRPENLMATYVKNAGDSITIKLIQMLNEKNYNILYLPRYQQDINYVKDFKNIFMPSKAINGLDACYFSSGVLSGAGTLSREAACLGKCSVSFFAGKTLLAVDQQMIKEGRIFHSRIPEDIVAYIENYSVISEQHKESKTVQKEVFNKLDSIILN